MAWAHVFPVKVDPCTPSVKVVQQLFTVARARSMAMECSGQFLFTKQKFDLTLAPGKAFPTELAH